MTFWAKLSIKKIFKLLLNEIIKQNNIVYGFCCQDNRCEETYIGETKQTLAKRMYQHRRPSTSGCGDSAVYSHLNTSNHSFVNENVIILDRESWWFERGVKEALYVKSEESTLNKGEGLRHNLAGAYSSAIKKIPRRLKSSSTPSRVSNQTPLEISWLDDAFWIGRETLPV